jgi:hypothetical protein
MNKFTMPLDMSKLICEIDNMNNQVNARIWSNIESHINNQSYRSSKSFARN